MGLLVVAVCAAGWLFLGANSGHAAPCEKQWNNAAGGSTDVAANWDPVGTPTATDVVCISLPGTYTVDLPHLPGVTEIEELHITNASATFQVQRDLRILNGGDSSGTIVLTSSGAHSVLNPRSTFINTGTISVPAAGTGTRFIEGTLTNQGTVQVDMPLILISDVVVPLNNVIANEGTWTLSATGSITTQQSPRFEQRSGTFTNNGAWVQQLGTWHYQGGDVNGTPVVMTFTSSLSFGGAAVNPFDIAIEGATTSLATDITSGVTVLVRATDALPDARLNPVPSTTVNNGTIALVRSGFMPNLNSIIIIPATRTLTNAGTLSVPDGGGVRRIDASGGTFNNAGTVDIDRDFVLNIGTFTNSGIWDVDPTSNVTTNSANPTNFTMLDGTLTVDGTFLVSGGGTFRYEGGEIEGTSPVTTKGIGLFFTGTVPPAPFAISAVGINTMLTDLPADITVRVEGDDDFGGGDAILHASGITNNGTIELTSTSIDTNHDADLRSVTTPFTNNGTIRSAVGSGNGQRIWQGSAQRIINGTVDVDRDLNLSLPGGSYVTNAGATWDIASGASAFTGGQPFTQTGGTLDIDGTLLLNQSPLIYSGGVTTGTGDLIVRTSSLTMSGAGPASPYVVNVEGLSSLLTSIVPNVHVRIRSTNAGAASLTGSGSAQVNNGTVVLTTNCTVSCSAVVSQFIMNSAGFTNNGRIDVPNTVGARSLISAGVLTNNGTIDIARDVTISSAATGDVSNSGIFNVSAGTTTIGAGADFQQLSGTLMNAGTLLVNGGELGYEAGQITGAGERIVRAGRVRFAANPLIPVEVIVEGASTLGDDVPSNLSLNVRGTGTNATLASTSDDRENDGTIRLTSTGNTSAALDMGSRILVNDGVIESVNGGTGARSFQGTIGNNGTLRPSSITQDLTHTNAAAIALQSTGTFEVDVASSSSYDRLRKTVAGPIAVGGTLAIANVPGYQPALNDTLTIIDANGGARSGTFSTVTGTDAPGPMTWSVVYNPTTVQLKAIDGDDDNDGVVNSIDECPNTPPDEVDDVDAVGCSPSQLDDDNDGVSNDIDECPNTPPDEVDEVDAVGCSPSQLDDDSDGVSNDIDECPNTPPDEVDEVDAVGCGPSERDTDEDGVNDDLDLCPNTPPDTDVDSDGCSDAQDTDDDDDGTPDVDDDCPNTATGEDVEDNGCAVSDVQPDGTVKLNTDPSFVGDDVYEPNGESQHRLVQGKKKKKFPSIFTVVFENEGTQTDDFKITGCLPIKGFKIVYTINGIDQTPLMTSANGFQAELDVGETITIEAKFTLSKKAKKSVLSCPIAATSTLNTAAVDTVFADVSAAKLPTP